MSVGQWLNTSVYPSIPQFPSQLEYLSETFEMSDANATRLPLPPGFPDIPDFPYPLVGDDGNPTLTRGGR